MEHRRKIKGGHAYRLNMDIHRASGLWLWLLLLPIAISSVAMNLPAQVFKPAISLFSPVEPSVYEARGVMPKEALGVTQLTYQQAYQRAQEEGARLGLSAPIGELYYSFEYNFYGAGFGQHDTQAHGKSRLFFHGTDGQLIGQEIAGEGTLGEQFYRLQLPIHGGASSESRAGADCDFRGGDRSVIDHRGVHLVAQATGTT